MSIIICLLAAWFAMPSCNSPEPANEVKKEDNTVVVNEGDTIDVIRPDTATIYSDVVNKKNCFILIAKPEYRLYVCEVVDGDTIPYFNLNEVKVVKYVYMLSPSEIKRNKKLFASVAGFLTCFREAVYFYSVRLFAEE